MSPSASVPKKPSGKALRISFTSIVAKSASNFAAASCDGSAAAERSVRSLAALVSDAVSQSGALKPVTSMSHPPDLGDQQAALRHRLQDPEEVARRRAEHVEHVDDLL